MKKNKLIQYLRIVICVFLLSACGIPQVANKAVENQLPNKFGNLTDTNSIATVSWREFFKDPYLIELIDTALSRNQELNIFNQEILMLGNEVQARKGEYLPNLDVRAGGGVEKVGRYTSQGSNDANTPIAPGVESPDPLTDMMIGGYASWEVDVWRKLRNAKDAAYNRYLASIEGKKFLTTNLVAEIAHTYYELLELDNKLALINEYVILQNNVLKAVRVQKQAGEATELAVKKFEAEVLNTRGTAYIIKQAIIEKENKLNFLSGKYPQAIPRDPQTFNVSIPDSISTGIPSQLLINRPDIVEAEYRLIANKLDLKVARAAFYPSVSIGAGFGLQAFNAKYFIQSPESILYSLTGELVAPLLNRKAIKSDYLNANSRQIQAIYSYEQTILNAFIETSNQISNLSNLSNTYRLKSEEVAVLKESISIASKLFSSAKADYMEVLIAQRDVLSAQIELVEYKNKQFDTLINLYRALGGGWK